MKKLLSILGILTLNIGIGLSVVACDTETKEATLPQLKFISILKTYKNIDNLVVDKDGNIYAVEGKDFGEDKDGNIFKCKNGQTDFNKMSIIGTTGHINSLVTDKDGNIYAACKNVVYKCLAGQTEFTAMTGITGNIKFSTTSQNGTIYVGDDYGEIYILSV